MKAKQDHEYDSLLIAALLHDVGKFWQRAGVELTPDDEKTIGAFCPAFEGRPSHIHAAVSAKFIRELLGPRWSLAEKIAGYHHRPESAVADYRREALAVALADRLSSGEREARAGAASAKPADEPLVSVFSTLAGSDDHRYFPLTALAESGDRHMPIADKRMALSEGYGPLWEAFEREARLVAGSPVEVLTEQLLALLEKYTLFVPSAAYRQLADISLYHHSKSTAAIAACLYHDAVDENWLTTGLKGLSSGTAPPEPVARLVGGDLSGIQPFVYNLTAKGALKGLRGRSLYLQFVPEAVASGLLDRLSLSNVNQLYCGGDHFYLLVPGTDQADSLVTEYAQSVEETLLQAHKGRIGFGLASVDLALGDFSGKGFGLAWDRLHQELAGAKRRRFARVLAADPVRVLGPHGAGGIEGSACEVCGDELGAGDEARCRLCQSFEEMARELHDARVISETLPDSRPERLDTGIGVLSALGRSYRLLPETAEPQHARVLNSTDFAGRGFAGFRFLAAHVPSADGQTATLEDMVDRADGIARWGALRADVDNLGKTFKDGLGAGRSVSRLSMLSYLVAYFFSARVQTIAREEEYRDKVYLAYAGGDDLFAIGSWSVLPVLAARIRDEFDRFTSGRLTLSAGVAIAPGEKFPVYEAADLAGTALDLSKELGRDRLTFMDRTLGWSEFPGVEETRRRLARLMEDGAPRTMLGILRRSWTEKAQAESGPVRMFPIWRLLYAFKRLKGRHKTIATAIQELEQDVVRGGELHPYLDLVVRWVEYEIRRSHAE